eukprot:COSAG06_NODE_2368_length_6998_cov_3.945934_3_plen_73_part_00
MSFPPSFFFVLSCITHAGLDQEVEGKHRPVQKVRGPDRPGAGDGPGLGRAAARVVSTKTYSAQHCYAFPIIP